MNDTYLGSQKNAEKLLSLINHSMQLPTDALSRRGCCRSCGSAASFDARSNQSATKRLPTGVQLCTAVTDARTKK